MNKVICIVAEYNPFHNGHKYQIDKIREKYKDSTIIVVFKEEFDKTDGIYIVSDIEGVDKKDIYTIGDASNDKGMLLEFNGYKMPYSYPEIMFSRARLTSSVKSLVRKIERKSHE